MKIAFFSTKTYDRKYFEQYNTHHQTTSSKKNIPTSGTSLTFFENSLNDSNASLFDNFDGVCVFVNDKLDEGCIEKIAKKGIKLIALRCAGFNNIDLLAAKKWGIKVVRVPSYSPQAVAEHAVALILTLNRKTHKVYNRVREGNFSLENLSSFNLYGKTVGVIGTGQIGKVFCQIMLGFGCKVLAYDVVASQELSYKGVKYTSIDELYAQSDIISLQCPLTDSTYHLINSDSILKMKTGVMLINTSRGGLVKTEDIIHGLKTAKIGYLGIDVYEQEEYLFFKNLSECIIQDDLINRLISFPNVLITPHQGFFTEEALIQIATTTLQNIREFENGEGLKNEVKIENL